jgi:hypothetical protein
MFSVRNSHGHAHGKSPPQALIEHPNWVLSLSPGCDGGHAQAPSYPGYRHRLFKLDPAGVARAQAQARLTFVPLPFNAPMPHPKSTLSPVYEGLNWVENSLVPPSHKPVTNCKSGPKIRGYKPITNRHKPKNFIMGRRPNRLAVGLSFLASPRLKFFQPIVGYCSLFTRILAFLALPGRHFMATLHTLAVTQSHLSPSKSRQVAASPTFL